MKLHQCQSCGYLSNSGAIFSRVIAANGRSVKVCDDCSDSFGLDSDVTRWVNQAAGRIEVASVKQSATA